MGDVLIKRSFLLCTLFLLSHAFAQSSFANNSAYRLSVDDIISVIVFNEPELNLTEVKINDEGNISVPLLGQVNVQDKTAAELEVHLTELFEADYLVDPRITVTIDEYRPFYINGEVEKPGSYPYRVGLTIEMAVTIAGGFTERASRQKIFVIAEKNGDRKRVTLNDNVAPGDVITIEESFF